MTSRLCYLDNAATSFPKPPTVGAEMANCINSYCGNAGRGAHRLSLVAADKIYACREAICRLVGAPGEESVIFVPSCTYGLNLIIKGVLGQGDHVLISDMEHNAVLRPISRLAELGAVSFSTFPALGARRLSEDEMLAGIEKRIRPNTRLVLVTPCSNICSYSLPIRKIGELCKKNNVLFAIDAAQTIGHYKIDMQEMNINFLSAPGHKGLFGPQGSAFVAINSSIPLETLIEGGNGVDSLMSRMPLTLPERHESGTLPLPSIVGLHEGIKFVGSIGEDEIHRHECRLFRRLRDGLCEIGGVSVHAPECEGSTLSFNLDGISVEQVCSLLDGEGICVRGGFHCTALGHRALGTQDTGTIRASFSCFNSHTDIDRLLAAVRRAVGQK